MIAFDNSFTDSPLLHSVLGISKDKGISSNIYIWFLRSGNIPCTEKKDAYIVILDILVGIFQLLKSSYNVPVLGMLL